MNGVEPMASKLQLVLLTLHLYFLIALKSDERPNILLLIPDEWRFDWADNFYLTDLKINTPTFQMVVSNGTRFINTVVGSPLCAPSRGCIATGKEYDYSGMEQNMQDLPENQTTFYKLLQNNGYHTMVTGKDDLTKLTGVGVDGSYRAKQLGFSAQRRCLDKTALPVFYPNVTDPFTAYLANQSLYNITDECYETCCDDWPNNGPPFYECPESINVPHDAYQDNWVTWNSLHLLDTKPDGQSWSVIFFIHLKLFSHFTYFCILSIRFMQVNFVGPHPPFIITKGMNETVNNRSFPAAMDSSFDPYDMQIVRRDYTAEIENLDKQFKIIIDKIIDINEFNNTIICISSDHGEMLGDFSLWQKSKPWIASTNVPLTCMGKDIKKGQIIDRYVTNMDLAGTFLDYANTQKVTNMTTQSLRPFMNGTWSDKNNEYREYVSSGLDNFRLVVKPINDSAVYKYVCCQHECPGRQFPNATHEGWTKLLFNLADDPYEISNIAQEYPQITMQLEQLLPTGFCQ